MRFAGILVLAAAVACGTSSSVDGGGGALTQDQSDAGQTAADGGQVVQAPQAFAVALGVTGSGEIDGLGDACSGTCIRQVQAGEVNLHAAAASGWTFDHWSVACTAADCSITVASDMTVAATFVQAAPPQPTSHKLTVTVTGQGRVTSTPSGIDCPGTCSATFTDGTQLSLDEAAGTGMLFSGFSNACAGTACVLTLGADAGVTATFAVDDCVGLMPARLTPALVPDLVCNGGCTSGTSDGGTGNFMLHFWANATLQEHGFAFYSVVNGTLQADTSWGFSTGVNLTMFSEPSGFALGEDFPGTVFSTVLDLDAVGNFESQTFLNDSAQIKVVVAPDPSGGFVAASSIPEGAGFTETSWQRFSTTGLAQSSLIAIDSERTSTEVAAAGVTLFGATLVETHIPTAQGPFVVDRQWVDKNGAPLTGTFAIPDQAGVHSYQPLLDGGLLERDGNAVFTRIWKEGSTQATGLPSWLSTRSAGSWLTSIRGGAGYAMAGTCGGVEVLAKSGRSCGCLAVPGLGPTSSIGRDGSLIVPRTDHYEIYPLLFH